MIGTIFNTAMIFCGSLLGTLFKKAWYQNIMTF